MADERGGREVGKTRDAGYQVGIRRTLPVDVAEAWRLVTSAEGMRAWLGDGARVELAPGHEYALADGSTGMVRVVEPESHLRLTWLPAGWPRPSTIQVRVIATVDGRATVAFHQEHLPSAAARQERRAHFAAALAAIERLATGAVASIAS
ncbi:MAG TPA: SRPBCC domain-containing protein [Longimicrobium sp.]|nr:SRPBCC domain-containing protein [Longimicrobium sp.]